MKHLSTPSYILIVTLCAISIGCIILLFQNSAYQMEIDDLLLQNDSLTQLNNHLSAMIDSLGYQTNLGSINH